jgi:hypothetical protein
MGTPARLKKLTSCAQTDAYGRITPEKSWNFGLNEDRATPSNS